MITRKCDWCGQEENGVQEQKILNHTTALGLLIGDMPNDGLVREIRSKITCEATYKAGDYFICADCVQKKRGILIQYYRSMAMSIFPELYEDGIIASCQKREVIS